MLQEYLDYADEKKARKALLTVSAITIGIASVEVLEGNVSILGLEIFVRQERLIALGQLSCALILFVFIIRSLPVYFELLKGLILKRIEREEKREKNAWEEEWISPSEPDRDPSGYYKQIGERAKYKRSIVEARYSTISFLFGALAILAVDFGVPLAMGAVATTNPRLVAIALDGIVEGSRRHMMMTEDENQNDAPTDSGNEEHDTDPALINQP